MRSQTDRKRSLTSGQTLLLPFPLHGGTREGAGRPRSNPRPRVAHVARTKINPSEPLFVTMRLLPGLPSVRGSREMAIFWKTLRWRRDRPGFRAIHVSVQANHLHAIVEADSSVALSRGMQGLLVSLARRWNRLWNREGPVFDGAYHVRPLASPREVRGAIVYVLQNGRKHGTVSDSAFDPCSSAAWFEGWTPDSAPPPAVGSPLASPRTWLLRAGWRRHGALDPRESPRASRGAARAGLVARDAE